MNTAGDKKTRKHPCLSIRSRGKPYRIPGGFPLLAIVVLSLAVFTFLLQQSITIAQQSHGTPGRPTSTAIPTEVATPTPTDTQIPIIDDTPTSTPTATSIEPTPGGDPTGTATPIVSTQNLGHTVYLPLISVSGHPLWAMATPLPTPTSPPPAPTDIPVDGNPHGEYDATTGMCAGCHRAHTGAGIVLRQLWPEEDVCFACHTAVGSGNDIESVFSAYTNTTTAFFKHDVAMTNSVHRLGQVDGADFSGANRHVECEDCHNPHETARGPTLAPMLQPEMNLVSGVDPIWTDVDAPSGYVWLPQAEREYQVCFKCHSGFTTLSTYLPDGWDGSAYVADGLPKLTTTNPVQIPDNRDLAREFNPYNASFHPVITIGRNQSIPLESFVGGWSQEGMVYCTDCHTNSDAAAEENGPHGSPLLHLLDGAANYSTVYGGRTRVSEQELCFECHNYETYVTGQNTFTNFYAHSSHLNRNWGVTCYTCHDSHGSEQFHLLNIDATAATFPTGVDSQTAWHIDDNGQASCDLTCHNRRHDNLTYWP